jgi:hypothetical protein
MSPPVFNDGERLLVFPNRPAKALPVDTVVYQLKITLQDIAPPIWRRIQIPADATLRELHEVIQTVFGWLDSHLHLFEVKGTYYGEPDLELDLPIHRADRTKVRTVLTRLGATMRYEYDFGDSWEHEIRLEGMSLAEEGVPYPHCSGGARSAPPEDCGGVPGYEELLRIIQDPDDEEHEDMLQWLGGSFDPEAFDLEQINWALQLTEDAR